MALSDLDQLVGSAVEVGGVRVIAGRVPLDSPKTLREIGDKVRDRLQSGVIVLGGEFEGKAALLAMVSKDLTGRIKAGDLINRVADPGRRQGRRPAGHGPGRRHHARQTRRGRGPGGPLCPGTARLSPECHRVQRTEQPDS